MDENLFLATIGLTVGLAMLAYSNSEIVNNTTNNTNTTNTTTIPVETPIIPTPTPPTPTPPTPPINTGQIPEKQIPIAKTTHDNIINLRESEIRPYIGLLELIYVLHPMSYSEISDQILQFDFSKMDISSSSLISRLANIPEIGSDKSKFLFPERYIYFPTDKDIFDSLLHNVFPIKDVNKYIGDYLDTNKMIIGFSFDMAQMESDEAWEKLIFMYNLFLKLGSKSQQERFLKNHAVTTSTSQNDYLTWFLGDKHLSSFKNRNTDQAFAWQIIEFVNA
jgi:hypothetical protein